MHAGPDVIGSEGVCACGCDGLFSLQVSCCLFLDRTLVLGLVRCYLPLRLCPCSTLFCNTSLITWRRLTWSGKAHAGHHGLGLQGKGPGNNINGRDGDAYAGGHNSAEAAAPNLHRAMRVCSNHLFGGIPGSGSGSRGQGCPAPASPSPPCSPSSTPRSCCRKGSANPGAFRITSSEMQQRVGVEHVAQGELLRVDVCPAETVLGGRARPYRTNQMSRG